MNLHNEVNNMPTASAYTAPRAKGILRLMSFCVRGMLFIVVMVCGFNALIESDIK